MVNGVELVTSLTNKADEWICIAGPRLHGQLLAEFSRTPDTEPSLRVTSATLWLYIHLKPASSAKAALRRLSPDKRPTLYIFRVQNHTFNGTATDKVHLHNAFKWPVKVLVINQTGSVISSNLNDPTLRSKIVNDTFLLFIHSYVVNVPKVYLMQSTTVIANRNVNWSIIDNKLISAATYSAK